MLRDTYIKNIHLSLGYIHRKLELFQFGLFIRLYKVAKHITYDIDICCTLRNMASNEGASYDFPMIVGSSNSTQINSLIYRKLIKFRITFII